MTASNENPPADRLQSAVDAHQAGRLADAADAYRRILAREPDNFNALHLLGLVEQAEGRWTQAESLIKRALAVRDDPVFWGNLAVLYHRTGRLVEAEAAYRRALTAETKATVYHNLGLLLRDTDRGADVEAETCLRRALALKPEDAEVKFTLGVILLARGQYSEAWPLYEARHERGEPASFPPPDPPTRRWRGEPLTGKSIVLVGEQGLGDEMQFVRYATLVKRRGAAKVTVIASPALIRLFTTIEGVDAVLEAGAGPHEADYWSYLMSLPMVFGTTPHNLRDSLADGLPYFRIPRSPAGRGPPLKVGVFWAGAARAEDPEALRLDAQRSMILSQLLPLLLSPGLAGRVEWTILQKERRPGDLGALAASHGWVDPFGETSPRSPRDMLDTARIVEDLDLVIGVDSALIHLSAGLGRPTWMMDRLNPCWRWRAGKAQSDWYPEVLRIFRQSRRDDWSKVVEDVEAALTALAAKP